MSHDPSRAGGGPVRPFAIAHRDVLRIALPMMIAYLSTPLVGLVATGVIGQLRDETLVGGVALAAVIFDVIFVSFNFLRGATTGFTAQAVGAGNRREEQRMLASGLIIALVAGLALLVLQKPIGALGLAAMGAEGPVAEAAATYFHWRIWSAPFVLFNFVVFGWIIGRGDALSGMILQTLLNGLNAALSYHWVIGLGWGLSGVAIAALVAEAVTALAGLYLILRKADRTAWSLPDPAAFRRAFSVNGDMMIRSFALLIGISFFTRQSGTLGIDILAANTILLRFYFFGVAFLDGVATAAEQLAGRAVGARYRPAFDRTIRLTTLWGFIFAGLVSLAFLSAGGWVIGITAPTAAVSALAHAYLPYVVALPVFGIVAFQMDGVYIGATWSRQMRNLMVGSLAIYFAAWAILQPLFGNDGLWIALILFQSARSIAFRFMLPKLAGRTFS
ncbi:MATE family efflux transporter [Rhizobiaceae bacterium BDR2-2]|uniref:MATE family efflux transporter n=1 Tax=Ectorhizobium quercum TaxID=2965071 RepID=A0AAE3SVG2_9HYPH|nr:MATE family efflux transporter [Ectorhizobium quercum]MCX8998300.1 MATE family efflux transporter [Ectorhizobium quercum]